MPLPRSRVPTLNVVSTRLGIESPRRAPYTPPKRLPDARHGLISITEPMFNLRLRPQTSRVHVGIYLAPLLLAQKLVRSLHDPGDADARGQGGADDAAAGSDDLLA